MNEYTNKREGKALHYSEMPSIEWKRNNRIRKSLFGNPVIRDSGKFDEKRDIHIVSKCLPTIYYINLQRGGSNFTGEKPSRHYHNQVFRITIHSNGTNRYCEALRGHSFPLWPLFQKCLTLIISKHQTSPHTGTFCKNRPLFL